MIICDSNIWYAVARNEINTSELSRLNLVTPFMVLEEISTSENLIHDPILVKKTLKCVIDYSEILELSPFDQLAKLVDNTYKGTIKHAEIVIKQVNLFISMPDAKILERTQANEFQHQVRNWDSPLKSATEYLNSMIPSIKENIKRTSSKKQHRDTASEKYIQELIIHYSKYTSETYNLDTEIEVSDVQWQELELLIKVWDTYFKDLELSRNMKFKKNDWVDLFNLIYVQPGVKYWTKDDKWLKIIERIGMQDYLFNTAS